MSFLRSIRRRFTLANREPIPRAERTQTERGYLPPDADPRPMSVTWTARHITRVTPPSNIRDWREE